MSALPAQNYISNAARTEGELKTALEDVRDYLGEGIGGGIETTLTLSTDAVTPGDGVGAIYSIDTEAAAAADDLKNIVQTNLVDGRLIFIRQANAARVVTVKNAAGGAGQILPRSGADYKLMTNRWSLLKRSSTSWDEIFTSTWKAKGLDCYYDDGNVGIGTASPASLGTGALTVNGGLLVGTTVVAGASAGEEILANGKWRYGVNRAGTGMTSLISSNLEIAAETAGDRVKIGPSKEHFEMAYTGRTTVSTVATTIFAGVSLKPSDSPAPAAAMEAGHLVIVAGRQASQSGEQFSDLVFFMPGGNAVVIATTNKGAPAARTYSVSVSNLQLAMAANTFQISVQALILAVN